MIRFTDGVSARLRRLATTSMLPALGEVLATGAQAIVDDAQQSIREGGSAGPKHVPSKPGEAPNEDTGELASSIHVGDVIEIENQVQTSVIVDAEYGAALELGTSRMLPRPFLVPATERQRGHIFDALVAKKRKIEAGQP